MGQPGAVRLELHYKGGAILRGKGLKCARSCRETRRPGKAGNVGAAGPVHCNRLATVAAATEVGGVNDGRAISTELGQISRNTGIGTATAAAISGRQRPRSRREVARFGGPRYISVGQSVQHKADRPIIEAASEIGRIVQAVPRGIQLGDESVAARKRRRRLAASPPGKRRSKGPRSRREITRPGIARERGIS